MFSYTGGLCFLWSPGFSSSGYLASYDDTCTCGQVVVERRLARPVQSTGCLVWWYDSRPGCERCWLQFREQPLWVRGAVPFIKRRRERTALIFGSRRSVAEKIPPPGLEPGPLGREPSILTASCRDKLHADRELGEQSGERIATRGSSVPRPFLMQRDHPGKHGQAVQPSCAIAVLRDTALHSGISGLVAEYIVAIDVTRVRFPADAFCGGDDAFTGS